MSAAVNQSTQWKWSGDTNVRAFTALKVTAGPKVETDNVRPSGERFVATTFMKREWSEGSVEGIVDYNEIAGLLEWALTAQAPVTAGGATTTSYVVGEGRTRALEVGDADAAAHIDGAFLTDIAFEFGRSSGDCTVKAGLVGGQFEDGFALTAGAVATVAAPATAGHVTVAIADSRAGLAAGAAESVLKASVSLGSLRDPLWLLNASRSLSGSTEKAVDGTVELLVIADSEGRGWLTKLRAGATSYVRITVAHPDGARKLVMDFAIQGTDHAREEADAVYAAKASFSIVRDASGFSHSFAVTVPAAPAAPASSPAGE